MSHHRRIVGVRVCRRILDHSSDAGERERGQEFERSSICREHVASFLGGFGVDGGVVSRADLGLKWYGRLRRRRRGMSHHRRIVGVKGKERERLGTGPSVMNSRGQAKTQAQREDEGKMSVGMSRTRYRKRSFCTIDIYWYQSDGSMTGGKRSETKEGTDTNRCQSYRTTFSGIAYGSSRVFDGQIRQILNRSETKEG
jgi:hypothetical protein